MGKIKKTAESRHEATLSPAVSSFIETASSIPLHRLPAHLASFPRIWPFPRGDLYHWIPVLNRFDSILELFNKEYGLGHGPQTQPFKRRLLRSGDLEEGQPSEEPSDLELEDANFSEEGDRELVESILSFTRTLLENCGNRSLYSSSSHLDSLLNSSSLSLLKTTLHLALRLAIRYNHSLQRTSSSHQISQTLLASHYNIKLDKLERIAQPFAASTLASSSPTGSRRKSLPSPFSPVRTAQGSKSGSTGILNPNDLVAIVKEDPPNLDALTNVRLDYYDETEQASEDKTAQQPDTPAGAGMATPTPAPRGVRQGLARTPSSKVEPMSTPKAVEPARPRQKHVEFSAQQILQSSPHELLKSSIATLPEDRKPDLLNRLRVAKGLVESLDSRRDVVAIRMLAIANLAFIYPDAAFTQKVLQHDSSEPRRLQLVYQLAELVHPPGEGESELPKQLQACAFMALDGLLRHKTRAHDVNTALSVNVNHGILFYVIRKVVAELGADQGDANELETDEWRHSVFNLLMHLPSSNHRTGEALVSAGLLDILIEVLALRTSHALRYHAVVLGFLNTFVYNLREAFQSLVDAKGLDVISELTAHQVASAYEKAQSNQGLPVQYRTQVTEFQIPYYEQQTLRALFKFMNHLMTHTPGNFDRLLRNLIDSPPLLGGLRTVLENPKVFGSNVWSGAMNIVVNFIHNEPTSYAIISEAGLSKAILETITQRKITDPSPESRTDFGPDQSAAEECDTRGVSPAVETSQSGDEAKSPARMIKLYLREGPLAEGILPIPESIATIPQAFGALCLNENGMKLFAASQALYTFFEIFESPKHVKVLSTNVDEASSIGSAFDELVRHHPQLKSPVLYAVKAMVARVGLLCFTKAGKEGVGAKLWVESKGKILVAGGGSALLGPEGAVHAEMRRADQQREREGKGKAESPARGENGDVEMTDASTSAASGNQQFEEPSIESIMSKEDPNKPTVTDYVSTVSKFLAGFLMNGSTCANFVEAGGTEYLLDLATLPTLPHNFTNEHASSDVLQVIQTLVESKPHLTLPTIIKRAQNALDRCELLLNHHKDPPFFCPWTDVPGIRNPAHDAIQPHGTALVKALLVVNTMCGALALSLAPQSYSPRSYQSMFGQVNLADKFASLVEKLGRLQLRCVWEDILLQNRIPKSWQEPTNLFELGTMASNEAKTSLAIIPELSTSPYTPGTPGPSQSREGEAGSAGESKTIDHRRDWRDSSPSKDSASYHNVCILRYLLALLPTSIVSFFQELGKGLLVKRNIDSYHKHIATKVSDAIAKAVVDQLRYRGEGSMALHVKYSYLVVTLASLRKVFTREARSADRGSPQILTLVLQSFKNQGGLNALEQIHNTFLMQAGKFINPPDNETRPKGWECVLGLAMSGIRMIESFYAEIVDEKKIIESSQSNALTNRSGRDRGENFEPGQFLVELRLAVLPPIRTMWNSKILDHVSSTITHRTLQVLQLIFEGNGEHGAYKRGDKDPRGKPAAQKPWTPKNPEHFAKLKEEGYAEDLAREALFRCFDNLKMAQEYCLMLKNDFRATRNPIPASEDAARPIAAAKPRASQSDHNESTAPVSHETSGATMRPMLASDGQSVLMQNTGGLPGNPSSDSRPQPELRSIAMISPSTDETDEDPTGPDGNGAGAGGSLNVPLETMLSRISNQEVSTASPTVSQQNRTTASPSPDSEGETSKLPVVPNVDDLNEERNKLRETLIERCLDVLNGHTDTAFDISSLISAAARKASQPQNWKRDVGEALILALISLQSDEDIRLQGKKIASYAHLLGLVIQDKEFFEANLDHLKENYPSLMEFVRMPSDKKADEQCSWIAPILLVTEKIMAEDAQPRQIQWTPPPMENPHQDTSIVQVGEPMVSSENGSTLFDSLTDMLPRVGKDESLALAICRVLVILTRERQLATRLGERRNLQRLFVMMKQLAGAASDRLHSAFMVCLRHVIEDDNTIRQIMRAEIHAMFANRQHRQIDTTTYARQMYHLVLRAPEIFVDVSNEMLMLPKFESSTRPQVLALKKDDEPKNGSAKGDAPPEGEAHPKPSGEAAEVQPSTEIGEQPELTRTKSEFKPPVVEHPDGVIHYLLCELLSYKDVEDKDSVPTTKPEEAAKPSDAAADTTTDATSASVPQDQTDASTKIGKPEFKADQHPIYIYRCFILHCLSELLSSYNQTKIEFINFSRKADPHVLTPSKPRSGVLNYLLNVLIPTSTVAYRDDMAYKKRDSTSKWAMYVVVALCSKTGEVFKKNSVDSPEQDEPELHFVRKFVLEHAIRAYKEAMSSSEPLDVKYARLLSISDLFQRMLTGKPMPGSSVPTVDAFTYSQEGLAKIMFEKNFTTTLTNSIAEIDLNFPDSKRVVKYVLRPLFRLTHKGVMMSESTSNDSSVPRVEEDEISSATSVSDEDEEREDTPDLYRNSTLGMFEPRGDEDTSSGSSVEDEDMYDDEYDEELDYDEEVPANDGDVVSDEDEDVDGMGPIEGLPGGQGMDIEVVIGGEGDSAEDDEDEDDDDEDEDMDDDDEMDGDGVEILEEVTGDDEGDSLNDPDDDEWEDEEDEAEEVAPLAGRRILQTAHGGPGVGDDPLFSSIQITGFNIDNEPLDEGSEAYGMGADMDPEGYIEDDMHEDYDDEDDDDDEDLEEGEIGFDRYGEELAHGHHLDIGWDDDDLPAIRHPRHHRVHGGGGPWSFFPGPPDRYTAGELAAPYRSHRNASTARGGNDDGTNPLLQPNTQEPIGTPLERRPHDYHMDIVDLTLDPINQNRQALSAGPVSFINELLSAIGPGGHGPPPVMHQHTDGTMHLTIGGPSRAMLRSLSTANEGPLRGFGGPAQHPGLGAGPRQSRDDPVLAVNFDSSLTSKRWQDEARVLYGPSHVEKTQRIVNSLLRLLVPPALEAEKARVQKRAQELAKRHKEEQRKAEEDKIAKEKAEQEAKEQKEREEREVAEKAARDAEAGTTDGTATAEGVQEQAEGDSTEAMEGVESTSTAPAGTAASSTAQPAERIRTTLRGRELDITGMGIDLEYLEALPEELREEVLMSQVAEQRSQAAAAGQEPTDISREFLEALPPEIREELLQQEAQDRRRREREEARRRAQAQTGQPARAEEMDPASFLASLDPDLRQSILMEQNEEMLTRLPREIAQEARSLGARRPPTYLGDMPTIGERLGDRGEGETGVAKKQRRHFVQMLDKSGVATLLRLMFVPLTASARGSLNGILLHLCENYQNRSEVIGLMLSILQDGTADIGAVERSFAQLSLRAKQASSQKTPQTPKRSPTNQLPSSNDMSAQTLVQQCLSTLVFLTTSHPQIPSFFLAEHDNVFGVKPKQKQKGKNKESKSSRHPINALLSLLERPLVYDSANIIEQFASLLSVITHPLTQLLKKDKDKEKPKEEAGETTAEAGPSNDAIAGRQYQSTSGPLPAQTEVEQEQSAVDNMIAGDITMTSPTDEQAVGSIPAQAPPTTVETDAATDKPFKKEEAEDKSKKTRNLNPPEVPEQNLRLVVSILAAPECNGKTFRDTLSTITNLSAVTGAKETFGTELIKLADELGASILQDLSELVTQVSNARTSTDVQGMALSKFSPASSDQAKLLRVLTALDYLFDPSRSNAKDKPTQKDIPGLPESQQQDILTKLYENSTFGPLWSKLSECLAAIRKRGNMFNVATILLPLIEALMVVCKNTTLQDAPLGRIHKEVSSSSPQPESRMEHLFYKFTEEHRKILNDLVRHSPKLMHGSFSLLVKNSKVLEFDNKRNFFNRRLHSRGETRHPHPPLQLSVRREQVFMDSYKSLFYKSAEEMKYGKLSIRFHGEEGVDAGGVSREWFQVLSRQMFNPDYALFVPVAADRTTFHPNRHSAVNENHLPYFKFIGRIIGKALYENRVLDCHFSRAVYKRILGKPVSIKDMETLDLDYYKSLCWILENDITDIITETFSIEEDEFGVTKIIDLVENGRNIPVTNENKREYVSSIVQHRLVGSVQEQLEHFLKGFHDVVPAELIAIFNEQELELLISGLPEIDVDDWKNNTEYHNYNASSPQIQWFWRAVRSFDKEERAKLLQFITGTSKVPLNGFKELEGMNGFSKFNIHRDYGSKERLPSSHTCFNQLDLPEYESYEQLRQQLYTAMTAGNEYFGFA